MAKVFEPGVVAGARAVGHVAPETDFEQFEGRRAKGREVLLVHVMIAVSCYFIGTVFGCDFVEGKMRCA